MTQNFLWALLSGEENGGRKEALVGTSNPCKSTFTLHFAAMNTMRHFV